VALTAAEILRPVPGAGRLVLLRLGLVVLASAPAFAVARSGISAGAATRPYYTDVEGPLPVVHAMRFLREIPDAYVPALFAGVVLAVLFDQLLSAGALASLRSPATAGRRVWSTVRHEGLRHLPAFLRLLFLALVVSALGIFALDAGFDRLGLAGHRAGWSASTLFLLLPGLQGLTVAVWLGLVGAWVLGCRALTVIDSRRRTGRTALLTLAVWRRRPLGGPVLYVVVVLVAQLATGALLVGWRQGPPGSIAGSTLWVALWLVGMALHSAVWVALHRAGILLYASTELTDLRARPDAPFGWLTRLRALLRRGTV
jgi:hypothetical protein